MRRWIPPLILLILLCGFYFSGLNHYLNLEIIKNYYAELKNLVNEYPTLSPVAYTLFYLVVVTLSIPDGALFSILAGLLFPQPLSTLCIVIGGSVGAIFVFLIARGVLHDWLLKRDGPRIQKMKANMLADAAHYLLFLRLTPFFPFWLTNLAPALFNVPLSTFVWTTIVGIIPTSIIFTQAGEGLKTILEIEGEVTWNEVFNPEVKLTLAMMTLLAFLPLIARMIWKGSKNGA